MLQPGGTFASWYEILREVAQGIYTTVYEARHKHPNLRDRPVALKVLRDRRYAVLFMHAAQIAAGLEHPHIPALCEIGEYHGQLYAVRTFVQGDDLQNGIGDGGRSITEVTRIITQIASALDYMHQRGIVHGSIHPRHVLIGNDGTVWLIGFGESPPADRAALSNPLHLAPEQIEPRGELTPATDVYALAETALWLLAAQHPFVGFRSADLLMAKRMGHLPRSIRKMAPSLSNAVGHVLLQGMAPDPSDRYPGTGEFAAALAEAGRSGQPARRWWFWS